LPLKNLLRTRKYYQLLLPAIQLVEPRERTDSVAQNPYSASCALLHSPAPMERGYRQDPQLASLADVTPFQATAYFQEKRQVALIYVRTNVAPVSRHHLHLPMCRL